MKNNWRNFLMKLQQKSFWFSVCGGNWSKFINISLIKIKSQFSFLSHFTFIINFNSIINQKPSTDNRVALTFRPEVSNSNSHHALWAPQQEAFRNNTINMLWRHYVLIIDLFRADLKEKCLILTPLSQTERIQQVLKLNQIKETNIVSVYCLIFYKNIKMIAINNQSIN